MNQAEELKDPRMTRLHSHQHKKANSFQAQVKKNHAACEVYKRSMR